jgi:hypothetical protein
MSDTTEIIEDSVPDTTDITEKIDILEITELSVPDIVEIVSYPETESIDIIERLFIDTVDILSAAEDITELFEAGTTPGPKGDRGPSGTGANTPGNNTGDFLRWNNLTESWEVNAEPVELKGLVLTPALASLIDTEGALYYNIALKSVLVCTDV